LLAQVQPNPKDQLVFLGDYIDRGPASRQVIETLLEVRGCWSTVFLRGNHEVMILDARDDTLKDNLWQSYGGLETLFSYDLNYRQDWVSKIPDSHWEFLERTNRLFRNRHTHFRACLFGSGTRHERSARVALILGIL